MQTQIFNKMYKITTFILLFLIFATFSYETNAQNWDIRTLEKINSNPNPFLKDYSIFISESTTAVAFAAPAALGIAALVRNDDEILKNALFMGASLLADGAMTYGLPKAYADHWRWYHRSRDGGNLP